MFKILLKDSSILGLTFLTPFFKKRVSHCAEKVQPIWQVTTMKCIAWLLLYTRTKWVEILSERLFLLFLWTCFSEICLKNVLQSYKRFDKIFVKVEEHWNKKKIIEKRCQPSVKKLSSKSLGGDIERYRSHREKGSF